MSEQAEVSRNKNTAQIAAILDLRTVVLSRGVRENVELGDVYVIREGESWRAILDVIQVHERMSIARAVWVHEQCPKVVFGTYLNRYDGELNQIMESI